MENQALHHQEVSSTETVSHRCYIGAGGVTLYNTDNLEDKNDDPRDGRLPNYGLLFFSPREALQFARYILQYEPELETREAELETQYDQVSQAVLAMFAELWNQQDKATDYRLDDLKVNQVLHDAYNWLINNKTGQVGQWYDSTWTDRFSHEQHEALFWRHFRRKYREKLLSDCLSI